HARHDARYLLDLHPFPTRRSSDLIIVFTVSGLWHGAEWQYLLWGLICGVISAVGRATLPARKVLWRHNPLYRAAWLQTLIQRCRSEEHTSELQSRFDLVCRLLLEK